MLSFSLSLAGVSPIINGTCSGEIVETTLYQTILFERAHYAAQPEQSQKGEREELVRDVDSEKDREAKATEHMLV